MRIMLVLPMVACAVVLGACDSETPVKEGVGPLPERVVLGDAQSAAMLLLAWEAEGAIPRADVNGDGVVNIVDLTIVARNFGMTVDAADLAIIGVVEADGRLLSREEDFMGMWSASWKVTLRNNDPQRHSFQLFISFLDADGFAVAETWLVQVHIGGQETLDLAGLGSVSPEVGGLIVAASARVAMWD